MSDLIDRGAFILEQCHNCDGCCELVECDCLNCTSEHRCEMIADLLAQPTIDAIPIGYIMQRADALKEADEYGARVLYGLIMIWNGKEQNDE